MLSASIFTPLTKTRALPESTTASFSSRKDCLVADQSICVGSFPVAGFPGAALLTAPGPDGTTGGDAGAPSADNASWAAPAVNRMAASRTETRIEAETVVMDAGI